MVNFNNGCNKHYLKKSITQNDKTMTLFFHTWRCCYVCKSQSLIAMQLVLYTFACTLYGYTCMYT